MEDAEIKSRLATTGADPGKQFRAAAGIPVVPAMDGFRALAILAIVVFHLLFYAGELESPVARVLAWGTLPNLVDALFIISGFVVFLPTVARGGRFGSLRTYAVRRAARLVPAYWLALLLVIAVAVTVWPLPLARGGPGPGEIGLHLAMLQMPAVLLDPSFPIGFGLDGPLWTLSVELTFYLLLPLVAGAYFRRPLVGLAVAAAITLAWKEGILHLDQLAALLGLSAAPRDVALTQIAADSQFPAWAFSFALGMTGAWAFVRLRERTDRRALALRAAWAQGLAVVGLAISAFLIGRYAIVNDSVIAHSLGRRDPAVSMLFSTSLAVFMLATAFAPRWLRGPFALPTVRRLGDISYGIYLIHLPVILMLVAVFSPLVGSSRVLLPVLVTAIPVSILYGWASARFLEQPIRRRAHRFGARAQGGPAVSPEQISAGAER